MPLVGLICRGCGGLPVPFDHFESTQCGETVCDPRLARAAVAHETGRYSYGKPTVTVTQLLGCPRQGAIQAAEDWRLDPLALNAALTGVAWDNFLNANYEKPGLVGVIEGFKVTGEPDFLDESRRLILDDKHQNDFGRSEIEKNGAKSEHIAQLSLYAELTRQTFCWRPERGIIVYHWSVNNGLRMVPVDLWPLEQVLAFKPHGGQFSVRDNLHNSTKPWREQPLAGETCLFKGGQSLCDYCSVKETCWKHAKGSAF